MELKISGIKCDNVECDYKNDDVKLEDYHLWLNKPCPLCGSNLLTEKDYNLCKKLIKFNNIFNRIFNRKKIKDSEQDKYYKIRCKMNGTGTLKVDSVHFDS